MKYDPSEDMKMLKKIFDIIDLSVPEELIKYLKVMKIKRHYKKNCIYPGPFYPRPFTVDITHGITLSNAKIRFPPLFRQKL
jgi:hypothetical protein